MTAAEHQKVRPMMKKKEKQAAKHELFLQSLSPEGPHLTVYAVTELLLLELQSGRSPYSKSHERRLKRKAREQIADGMSDMQTAISAVELGIPDSVQASTEVVTAEDNHLKNNRARSTKPGQIGEGKGVPLTKAQRKRALYAPVWSTVTFLI